MAGRPPGDSADGKKRLLDACWQLLVETPQGERLTIAAVCEKARCTPPTLYHHFGDLASLERAASRRAYIAWSEEVEASCAPIASPRERLMERGRAYLAWAQENPDAYTVLFSQPRKADDPNASTLHGTGFQSLLQDLGEIHGAHASDPSVLPLAFAYWAGIHGLASLSIAVPYFPQDVQESTLDILTESFVQHGPVAPPAWATGMSAIGQAGDSDSDLRKAS
ncbi:TetR/AcrR family transcriptional regulator [Tessaracoccus antarcticus]|uniref:TetR/AcrR family transcriptional regulator n=1 Tax=Tessaracoccus antarcticus TaxID=2479848 RepID=A0A3M0GC71_9ACTN|nr:TetR/AcrR family transcriptional regulator [Tessaracoccus antarcticus]RMB62047.1 TetR/AcrR family transcriptional regulator [Tessaracoccus antarcticus]